MKRENCNGMVLISVTLVLGVLMLLAFYFLDFVLTDSKISNSQNFSTQTYYATEAGIQEAIWKVKNDPVWNNNFQTNPNWSETIIRDNPFGNGVSYEVTIVNTDLGEADISTTGHLTLNSSQSQRVIKTKAFQALGLPGVNSTTTGIFTDEDMRFSGANINVINSGIFANNDISLSYFSEINIGEDAFAVDKISIPWGSSLTANSIFSDNYPPKPNSQDMPQIDFNSDDPESLLSRADHVYSNSQFNNLLNNNSVVNLSGIVYVTGNITIPRDTILNIDGALVSERNINLGTEWWPFWDSDPKLNITDPGTGPSGIFSMRQIIFASQAQTIDIDGLIYAIDGVQADWSSPIINLNGGIITRRLIVSNFFNQITITFDEEVITRSLGIAVDTPIINIEHWEEEY